MWTNVQRSRIDRHGPTARLSKSMTDTIENDFNKVSEVQNQIAVLAAQMETSKRAMITLDKIHRAVCVRESTAEQSNN